MSSINEELARRRAREHPEEGNPHKLFLQLTIDFISRIGESNRDVGLEL